MKYIRKDENGRVVKVGDRVRGRGTLMCNDGFQIDLTPEVTVREHDGVMYFGSLSESSFHRFVIVSPAPTYNG